MINLEKITVQIASKYLLEEASAQIPDGAKIGIVGRNGCGKTTLFKVLKGEHDVNSGEIIFSQHQQRAFVEQEIKTEDLEKPILKYVLSKDKKLTRLLEQQKTAKPEDLPEIMEQLWIIEADSAEARTAEILKGLGFDETDLTRPVKDFSGGWQMRLNLAGALFQQSDILFLDEPTNHLDLEAIVWLENYLQKYKGTILLISHDRDFLNNICKNIIHFEGDKLVQYGGNYDTFQKQYHMKIDLAEKQIKKQNERKAHLEAYIERFRYKASKARQAQSRIKMLEKMEDVSEVSKDRESHFNFPIVSPLPSPMITIDNGVVGYNGKAVLKKLNFCINQDDRIALLGKNGNGKSTLVKLISSQLPIMEGNIKKIGKLKIGYFNQNQTETLPLDLTPTEYMQSLHPEMPEKNIRSHLSAFGLEQEKATTTINVLSGGEKTRLVFAKISIEAPELLILDEPTNHLDIAGRDALAEALNNYQGAIILISHDFRLLELVVDNIWLVANHTCQPYSGDLEDYRKLLLTPELKKEEKNEIKDKTISAPKKPKIDRKTRVVIRELEQKLKNMEKQKELILSEFSQVKGDEIAKLQIKLHQLDQEISKTEEKWLELSLETEI